MPGYGQYCPVAKAAEVLGEKRSILILRELVVADQIFNSLRRGKPLISPSPPLLSKRLKTLMLHNVIERREMPEGVQYRLTLAGLELKEVIMQLGVWGGSAFSNVEKGVLPASALRQYLFFLQSLCKPFFIRPGIGIADPRQLDLPIRALVPFDVGLKNICCVLAVPQCYGLHVVDKRAASSR